MGTRYKGCSLQQSTQMPVGCVLFPTRCLWWARRTRFCLDSGYRRLGPTADTNQFKSRESELANTNHAINVVTSIVASTLSTLTIYGLFAEICPSAFHKHSVCPSGCYYVGHVVALLQAHRNLEQQRDGHDVMHVGQRNGLVRRVRYWKALEEVKSANCCQDARKKKTDN
jgi:hypothetical protein